jgi:hypothetical protein
MSEALAEKVRAELARYEHPLFDFAARSSARGIESKIRYKFPEGDLPVYTFELQQREIENSQFPWTFQKQLYDCLHDFIIEMFIRNPQRKD